MSLVTFNTPSRRSVKRPRVKPRWSIPICILAVSAIFLLVGGCASLPPNHGSVSPAPAFNAQETRLGRHFQKLLNDHPGLSGYRILYNSFNAYAARAVLIDAAERSIDMQYYIYHEDTTGLLIKNALLRAADRGVHIRLLLDDLFIPVGSDPELLAMADKPNIEIRMFNPISRQAPASLQMIANYREKSRRMHNKSFTVDNVATVVGGRNIGNRYFDADDNISFGDMDLFAIGPIVKEVGVSFEKFWNDSLAYPIASLVVNPPSPQRQKEIRAEIETLAKKEEYSEHGQAPTTSRFAKRFWDNELPFNWGKAKAIYDSPDKVKNGIGWTNDLLAAGLSSYFDNLRTELIIVTPYFIPGVDGVESLKSLVDRGVRVRVLTNSLSSNDAMIAHAWYARYRMEILKAGIELYEVDANFDQPRRTRNKLRLQGASYPSLHAKAIVFDRCHSFVGSFNWDPRSVFLNTELGVMVESPELANDLTAWFESLVREHAYRLELHRNDRGEEAIRWVISRNGHPEIYDYEPYGNFFRHLGVLLLSLLPIESEL